MTLSSPSSEPSVLFVCLGNICRSPTAEAVLRKLAQDKGLRVEIDSCGTGGGSDNWYKPDGFSYHEGEPSDERMSTAAKKRGIRLTSRSRPLRPDDFDRFDLVIGMEEKNRQEIFRAARAWGRLDEAVRKTVLMTDYCREYGDVTAVPDPYYGGQKGFEKVLDLLEDACEGLLQKLVKEREPSAASERRM